MRVRNGGEGLGRADREVLGAVVRHGRAARRLRLLVPSLLHDERLARQIEQRVTAQPGVRSVCASPRSGRVLIEYSDGAPILDLILQQAAIAPPPRRRERPRAAGLRERWQELRLRRGPAVAAVAVPPWHALAVDEVLARLESSTDGLSEEESARRLARDGLNLLEGRPWRAPLEILLAQLANLPTVLLLGSAALSLLLGDVFDAGAIALVVGMNAAIGYSVEQRNEQLLASWQRLEAGYARVIRDREIKTVPAAELVAGDLVLVRAGDVVPADARVLDAHRLFCDEAPLTGENERCGKDRASVSTEAVLAERRSMLYSGTAVTGGHGRAVVVATGLGTEIAAVRLLVEQTEAPAAPLRVQLDQLTRWFSYLGIGAATLAGAASLLHARPLFGVLRGAVALCVAALPEGLPVVATGALVRTMSRMRQQEIIVRRAVAAETIGAVTVICADKTGTLTTNRMRLDVLVTGGEQLPIAKVRARPAALTEHPPTLALAAALLNSDVDVQSSAGRVGLYGSSTERALVEAAHNAGLDGAALRRAYPRLALCERNQDASYVTSLHRPAGGGAVAFIKGAPEQVLALCDRELDRPLDDDGRVRVLRNNEELCRAGMRVLALAWQRLPAAAGLEAPPRRGYSFIGLAGLSDPVREGARDAVRLARRGGIRTVILTGDQRHTAETVARRVGITGAAIEGRDVGALLASANWRERIRDTAVFARLTPADKVAVVRALREAGDVVAMAGDGINDAPALKVADVGVAVGGNASDLARQTADIVMAGEDLRAILAAVADGRVVQDNLRRAIRFLFATNVSEILLVLGAALAGREALSPLQLLWINLLNDTLPALLLAVAPGDPDILERAPAPPGAPIIGRDHWRSIGRDAALLGLLSGSALAAGGQAASFSTIAASQLGYAAACHVPGGSDEPMFLGSLGGAAALQLLVSTWAPLRALLTLPRASFITLAGLAVGLMLPPLLAAPNGELVFDAAASAQGESA